MKAFSCTLRCLRPYHYVAFEKRSNSNGINVNRGALSNSERGESFTEPEVYRNKKNITAQIKTRRKVKGLLAEEHKKNTMGALNIDTQTEEGLRSGQRLPLTRREIEATRAMDAELAQGAPADPDYTRETHALLQREVARRDYMIDKFGQAPTSREFSKLLRQLRAADDDEEVIERHQQRLVEENGVYPASRMDAFMLDDDSYFPDWVHALPYSVRDRVKYGSLGLTEEDEAMRVRLGRLPRDKRHQEWGRLKAAKAYRAAKDETLTLSELRDVRQGKRRFHWLQRRRQKRASTLRRLALRKPEGYEVWPSSAVDYSQRIAFIAQHVENGVQTNGQWPLDPAVLTRAKIQRQQDAAERTFLMSAEEKKMQSTASMHGGIRELLSSFDEHEKPFKRVSRKTYANRVNAIVHGDQDEYGRRYRKMAGRSTRRMRPHESASEMAVEREVRKEPRINISGLNHSDDEHWPRREKSWVDGLPSRYYGS